MGDTVGLDKGEIDALDWCQGSCRHLLGSEAIFDYSTGKHKTISHLIDQISRRCGDVTNGKPEASREEMRADEDTTDKEQRREDNRDTN
jgi:hypothetical protein